MAIAMITPAQKGGRGKTVAVPQGFSKERISNARTVLEYAPDLAANVLSGSETLDAAYKPAHGPARPACAYPGASMTA